MSNYINATGQYNSAAKGFVGGWPNVLPSVWASLNATAQAATGAPVGTNPWVPVRYDPHKTHALPNCISLARPEPALILISSPDA